jgi:glutamate-1-semialdehyde 2,1-aminomutase
MQSSARIDPGRVRSLFEREQGSFRARCPASAALAARAMSSQLFGVPMNWMSQWPGDHALHVERAAGARLTDVDGHEYVDFCLGDTGSMAGHAPPPTVVAIARQAARGITLMLPTADANRVAAEMARRFGLPYWQFTLTATDANRSVIRWARAITGRPRIAVHNFNYHGSVDEALAMLDGGRVVARRGNVGPPVPPEVTTRVVEMNDIGGLTRSRARGGRRGRLPHRARAHEHRHRAAGGRLSRGGSRALHAARHAPRDRRDAHDQRRSRRLHARFRAFARFPDHRQDARRRRRLRRLRHERARAGNPLSLAAMHATLAEVLTPDAFTRMIALGERFEAGVQAAIDRQALPWHVVRLGCRVEYLFRPARARNGREAAEAQDPALDPLINLYLMNRGVLMTPFHNMALMSPATTAADVDRHTALFAAPADGLTRPG